MTQQILIGEGAFTQDLKDKVNENFTELYGSSGTFTADGASAVTVANANVTENSLIIITLKTVGGTVGAYPAIKTITPGTGFTVAATASDTSVYNYRIIS
jgi:hypothetical protein